jgi:hypothetical protein
MNNWRIYLVLVLALAACKKEPLPDLPEETPPYFLIQGNINGNSVYYNVGQEGIKIAHGKTLVNGVETYFGQILSPSDDVLIKMEFTKPSKNYKAASFTAFDFGSLSYLVNKPGCINFGFGQNLTQIYNMEIKTDGGNFVQDSQIEFEEYGIYDVTFKFTDFNTTSYVIPVQYGFKNTQLNSDFELLASGTEVNFYPSTESGTHKWFINGALVSTDTTYFSEFPIGIHKVSHELTDEYGNKSTSVSLMRISDFVLNWKMSMNSCASSTNEVNNYGKVNVILQTDGEIYKSSNSLDNLSKSFSITNDTYVMTTGPDPSRAVFDFNFDAILVNDSKTDSLSLVGMTGTFNIGL